MTMKKKKRSGEAIVERGRSSCCACVLCLFFIMREACVLGKFSFRFFGSSFSFKNFFY